MTTWMSSGRKTYDNVGLLLQRLGATFIGAWIGGGVTHDYPSGFYLTKFAVLLGFGLLAIAHYRAKTPPQNTAELHIN